MAKKVLIVDDEAEIRDVIKDLLESLGLDIEVAEDGQEAIDKIKLSTFDMIISDQKMPHKTGLEILIWMRSQKILTPFLLQTAYSQKDLQNEANQHQVLSILSKPWDPKELVQLICDTLDL